MKSSNNTKPGVMIYFETKNCIRRLSDEEKGRLFDAILNYGEYMQEPDFSADTEIALCVAWDVIKPKIDADSLRYKEKKEQTKNAAESRWKKNQ